MSLPSRTKIFLLIFFVACVPKHFVAAADPICCKCTSQDKQKSACVKIPDIGSCFGITVQQLACDPDALTTVQCQKIGTSASAQCPGDPISPGDVPTSTGSAATTPETKILKSTTPQLGVPIPGLKFSPITQEGANIVVPFLAQYISAVYRYLVGVSVIIAIIMVVYGGFRYLLGSALGDIKHGKEIIRDAIGGLILIFAAYLILQTINPATLGLNAITVRLVPPEPTPEEESADVETAAATPSTTPSTSQTAYACHDVTACRALCAQDPSTWPTTLPGRASPDQVVTVENSPGIYNPNKIKVLPDLIDPLKKAGEIASQEGYLIKVLAGWRSLTTQIKLVCGAISSGREDKLGPFIGWPGGNSTGHGGGRAIDMELWKDGARLVPCCSSDQQKDPQWIPGAQKLVEIMTKAGWRRLSTEIWHFEYGSNASCRCDANSGCPPSGGHC